MGAAARPAINIIWFSAGPRCALEPAQLDLEARIIDERYQGVHRQRKPILSALLKGPAGSAMLVVMCRFAERAGHTIKKLTSASVLSLPLPRTRRPALFSAGSAGTHVARHEALHTLQSHPSHSPT